MSSYRKNLLDRLAESAPARFVSHVAPCELSRTQGAMARTIVILNSGVEDRLGLKPKFIPVVTARRMM